jgi:GrpB-like predicted nucleotidyltransferase (UPF0157 family)
MILAFHNPEWGAEFEALRDVYTSAFGKLIMRVEHVGSTAVPNLMAKPILDIDIVMPSYESYRNEMRAFDDDGLMRRREAASTISPSPKATASSSGPLPAPDRRTTPASLTSSNPDH